MPDDNVIPLRPDPLEIDRIRRLIAKDPDRAAFMLAVARLRLKQLAMMLPTFMDAVMIHVKEDELP